MYFDFVNPFFKTTPFLNAFDIFEAVEE